MVTTEELKKVRIPKAKELMRKENRLAPGHRLCAGCTAGTIARCATLVTDPDNVCIFHATGCLEVATTVYPFTAWRVPWFHNAFENVAATASGAEAAYRVMIRKGKLEKMPDIIAFAGDGGTYDIGLQSLSGALERGHDFGWNPNVCCNYNFPCRKSYSWKSSMEKRSCSNCCCSQSAVCRNSFSSSSS